MQRSLLASDVSLSKALRGGKSHTTFSDFFHEVRSAGAMRQLEWLRLNWRTRPAREGAGLCPAARRRRMLPTVPRTAAAFSLQRGFGAIASKVRLGPPALVPAGRRQPNEPRPDGLPAEPDRPAPSRRRLGSLRVGGPFLR